MGNQTNNRKEPEMKGKIDRQRVYNKYDGRCAYCGQKIEIKIMQIDHIIPKRNFLFHIKNKHKVPQFLSHLKENDVNHIDNLMPSCKVCNKWKSVYDLDTFRSEILKQIERLNKYSAAYRLAKRYGLIEEWPEYGVTFYFEALKANKETPLNF